MVKSILILIVSDGLSPRKQPCAALAHDSNMKCNVLCNNRFHKPDSTLAYLFQTSYSKVPNQSRSPVSEFVGYIYSYSAQRTTSNQLPIRLLIISFGSKVCKHYLEDRDFYGNTFRSVNQMAQHTNHCHDIAIIIPRTHCSEWISSPGKQDSQIKVQGAYSVHRWWAKIISWYRIRNEHQAHWICYQHCQTRDHYCLAATSG